MSFAAARCPAPPGSGSRSPWRRAVATAIRSPSTHEPPGPPGLGLDEISRARNWASGDPREAALLTFLKALFESDGPPAAHLLEEAREVDWSDEQLLEAVAHVALNEFQSLMANAAALPQDQIRPDGPAVRGCGLAAASRYLIGAARIMSAPTLVR